MTASARSPDFLLMGSGGAEPGLYRVGGGAPVECLAGLPAGHSAYAIDVDVDEGRIAVGSRRGRIDLLSWSEGSGASVTHTLAQGAPILSLCLLSRSRLASADAAGRCLLWCATRSPPTNWRRRWRGGEALDLEQVVAEILEEAAK